MKSHILIMYSLFFILILCLFLAMFFFKKDTSPEIKAENKKSSLFLQGIDFSDGDYSLYIHDPTQGEFMIFDEDILKTYQNQLKIRRSLLNFLPGNGDRTKGFILFKDRQAFSSIQGIIFSQYEIGDILHFAQKFEDTFEKIDVTLSQKEFGKKFDFKKLQEDSHVYHLILPEFPKDGFEYYFLVSVPSLLFHQDTPGERENFEKNIFITLSKDLQEFGEFSLSPSIFVSITEQGIYVRNTKNGDYVTDSENKVLVLEGYTLVEPQIYIRSSQEFYEKVQNIDFKKYFLDKTHSDTLLKDGLENLIKTNNILGSSVENLELENWNTDTIVGELIQEQYTLSYWKKK